MKLLLRLLARLGGKVKRGGDESDLEALLGHTFHDRSLLLRALTHRSFLQVSQAGYDQSNELLEFLGDAVLDLIIVDHLYRRFPDRKVGDLSKLKSALVSGQALHHTARGLDLGRFIRLSENEVRNGGRGRSSILEDTFEAVVGALYLDGGMDAAKGFIRREIIQRSEDQLRRMPDHNYKSRLLEYVQAHGWDSPLYRVVAETGPEHAKQFEVEVIVRNKSLGRGSGKSKKEAQQQAAQMAFFKLTGEKSAARAEVKPQGGTNRRRIGLFPK